MKKFKKITSMALLATLCLASSVPSFAAEGNAYVEQNKDKNMIQLLSETRGIHYEDVKDQRIVRTYLDCAYGCTSEYYTYKSIRYSNGYKCTGTSKTTRTGEDEDGKYKEVVYTYSYKTW
ncbi:hypothetical protein [Inediibacterium massiliense]|uniref:hypothetical protein n=1 Tax=Inediibacterium massiliense TaxID=1658111 RepID=UPI0006B4DA09|nr:hypothetical protein [Inediibacterium massiliense]